MRTPSIALIYVLFMVAAGVVAGVGVLTGSSILVVGAMALSPDLLPISAAAVGLVDRRWPLAGRAFVTLAIGMAIVALAACATTALLRLSGRIEQNLELADSVLGPSLTRIGPGSVLVALAAGMAGMLAYETAERGRGRSGDLGDHDPGRRLLRRLPRLGRERARCLVRPGHERRVHRGGRRLDPLGAAAASRRRRG